jgi:hypothetical protein
MKVEKTRPCRSRIVKLSQAQSNLPGPRGLEGSTTVKGTQVLVVVRLLGLLAGIYLSGENQTGSNRVKPGQTREGGPGLATKKDAENGLTPQPFVVTKSASYIM